MSKRHRERRLPPRRARPLRNSATGAVILEALVAALIFALAALALGGLHTRAVTAIGDAHVRVEARHLAHATLARMQAADRTTLYADYDMRADGRGYRALVAQAQRLPGVAPGRNAPEILITAGPSAGSRAVTVAVLWAFPGDATARRYAVSTAVSGS